MICTYQKYDSCDENKENQMSTTCSTQGEKTNVYSILVREPK